MVVAERGAEDRCSGQPGRDSGNADHLDRPVGDFERRRGHRIDPRVAGSDQRHREAVSSPVNSGMRAFLLLSKTR